MDERIRAIIWSSTRRRYWHKSPSDPHASSRCSARHAGATTFQIRTRPTRPCFIDVLIEGPARPLLLDPWPAHNRNCPGRLQKGARDDIACAPDRRVGCGLRRHRVGLVADLKTFWPSTKPGRNSSRKVMIVGASCVRLGTRKPKMIDPTMLLRPARNVPPVISTSVMLRLFARRQRASTSAYFTNSLTPPSGLGLLASPRGGDHLDRAARGSVAPRKMACRPAGGSFTQHRFKAINSRTREGQP
jgi:hypothetical protein